jgi:hypothetical protein
MGSGSPPPQSYKSYKNQKFTKHTDLLKNSLRQIRDCSLKQEDKAKLLVVLAEVLANELDKIKAINPDQKQGSKY